MEEIMEMMPRRGCILVCPLTAEVDGGLYSWLLTPCSGAGGLECSGMLHSDA